jgi:ATP-binding cassette, subfamily C (CFTR/MRP), member 1
MFTWKKVLISSLFFFVQTATMLSTPFILNALIDLVSDINSSIYAGIGFAFLFFIVNALHSISNHSYYYYTLRFQLNVSISLIQVESALQTFLYKKVLKLSSTSRRDKETGEIVNLMSVDVEQLGNGLSWVSYAFCAFLQVSLSTVFLFYFIGISAIVGIISMVVLLPLAIYFTKKMGSAEHELLGIKDDRVKVINELLLGMRVVKYFTWERKFEKKVENYRQKEYSKLLQVGVQYLLKKRFIIQYSIQSRFSFRLLGPF